MYGEEVGRNGCQCMNGDDNNSGVQDDEDNHECNNKNEH
jgi:hypothetical protein